MNLCSIFFTTHVSLWSIWTTYSCLLNLIGCLNYRDMVCSLYRPHSMYSGFYYTFIQFVVCDNYKFTSQNIIIWAMIYHHITNIIVVITRIICLCLIEVQPVVPDVYHMLYLSWKGNPTLFGTHGLRLLPPRVTMVHQPLPCTYMPKCLNWINHSVQVEMTCWCLLEGILIHRIFIGLRLDGLSCSLLIGSYSEININFWGVEYL